MYTSAPNGPAAPTSGPSPGAIIGTIVWRLMVAGIAFWGVYVISYTSGWGFQTHLWWELSQLASLIVAAVYALLALIAILSFGRWLEPWGSAWLRGALAVMLLLVAVISIFVLPGGGQLENPGFLLEHLIVPIVVAIDAIVVGRRQLRLRAWMPLTWVVFPLGYWLLLLATGREQMYMGMLDPQNSEAPMYIGGFTLATIGLGYGIFGLIRTRGTGPIPPLTGPYSEPSPGYVPSEVTYTHPGSPQFSSQQAYPSHTAPPAAPPAPGYSAPAPSSIPEGPGPAKSHLSGLPDVPDPPVARPEDQPQQWPTGQQGAGQPGQTGQAPAPQTPPP